MTQPAASIDLQVQLVAVGPVDEVREVENGPLGISCQLSDVQQSRSHWTLEVLSGEGIGRDGGGLLIRRHGAVSELVERDEHRVATQTARRE